MTRATWQALVALGVVACADRDPVGPVNAGPSALRWASAASGAFVDDSIRLYALYVDSAGRFIDQPRPTLTWSSSDSTRIRVVSDTLALVLDTGAVVLSGVARTEPLFQLEVPLMAVPRFTGRLIWIHQPTRGSQFRDVMVQDFPTGAARQLHHFGHATESKAQPALTADGRVGVVVSSPPNTFGSLRLYLVDLEADTSRMLFTTVPGSYHFWPIWMPGDSVLAFLGGGGVCGNQVLTARLDGTNLLQRTATPQCSPPFFDVTPEEHLVLLLERHFVPGQGNNADVYEITMAGDTVRRLTNTTTYEGWPAVSPDGSQIAYMRGEEVWLMNRDGSGTRPLLPAPSSVWGRAPAWSRDGKYVVLELYADTYIDRNSNGEDYYYNASQIYAVRVADGLAIRLTHTATGEVQPDIR